jgi:hypothetical protein
VCIQSSEIRIAIQTAQASTLVDPQGSIVGAPAFAKMVSYMYEGFAESPLLIGLTLLSFQ